MMEFNASNYTNDWMSLWTAPYIHVFGDFFFVILLLIVAAGIYIGSDKNTFVTATYCLVVATIFGIFGFALTAICLMVAGFVFAGIAYNAFIEKKQRYN